MSSFLRLLLLLVIVATATCAADDSENPDGGNYFSEDRNEDDDALDALTAEADEQLEGPNEQGSNNAPELENSEVPSTERTVNWSKPPTLSRPTQPPPVIQPTPPSTTTTPPTKPILVDPPKPAPTEKPIEAPTAKPVVVVNPAKPDTPTPVVYPQQQPLCGRRSGCYQWFKDEVELFLEGYTRCDALHEYRARKYCCVHSVIH